MFLAIQRDHAADSIIVYLCTQHIGSNIHGYCRKGRITMVDPVSGRLRIDIRADKVRQEEPLIQLFLTLTA